MSLRRPSHHELLSFAVLAAASLGVTMDVPLTKKQRLLPGEKPCLNCGEPKRHANAFCSSACCRDWKLKKREGLGE